MTLIFLNSAILISTRSHPKIALHIGIWHLILIPDVLFKIMLTPSCYHLFWSWHVSFEEEFSELTMLISLLHSFLRTKGAFHKILSFFLSLIILQCHRPLRHSSKILCKWSTLHSQNSRCSKLSLEIYIIADSILQYRHSSDTLLSNVLMLYTSA